MRMLDLFSGIGGFALAAEWVWGDELDITGFCEIEKYAQKVLQKNFPGVPIYDDITKLNGKDFKNIDLITGGFPCQDNSHAKQWGNKRLGLDGKKSGLWSEMWRLCSKIRPKYIIIENVPGIITVNDGRDFRRILCDFAEGGYNAQWNCPYASSIGTPHHRARMFMVAYTDSNRLQEIFDWESLIHETKRKKIVRNIARTDVMVGNYWASEPEPLRVLNGIPSRVDRLKGLGNAIVPQVAALIMERIKNAQ